MMDVEALITTTIGLVEEYQPEARATFGSVARGDFGQVALSSRTGRGDDFVGHWNGRQVVLADEVYQQVYDEYPDTIRIAANVLYPGGSLDPHEEARHDRYRWHLPVQTNPDAVLVVDGDELHLPVGQLYRLDPWLTHSARNDGTTPRIHLVWDVPRGDA